MGTSKKGDTVPERPLTDAEHEEEGVRQYPKMFITGMGSMMTMHFVGPERAILQTLFFHWLLSQGIYLAQRGFMALNIKLNDRHVERYVAAVDGFCEEYADFLRWQ